MNEGEVSVFIKEHATKLSGAVCPARNRRTSSSLWVRARRACMNWPPSCWPRMPMSIASMHGRRCGMASDFVVNGHLLPAGICHIGNCSVLISILSRPTLRLASASVTPSDPTGAASRSGHSRWSTSANRGAAALLDTCDPAQHTTKAQRERQWGNAAASRRQPIE